MRKRGIPLLVVSFWLLLLISGTNLASGQTQAYVTVRDTSLVTGDTYHKVTVFLQNDVPIGGVALRISLGRQELMDFTTDRIEMQVDSSGIPWDTSYIRHCKIGITGNLIDNFDMIEAHGEVGDPAFLECDWVNIVGMVFDTASGQPIPPGSGVLLEFYVDVLCLPDSSQDRMGSVYFDVAQCNLSDPVQSRVETEYYNGSIVFNQTFCGTLEECLCGDVDASKEVNIVDVVYMIQWLFNSGPDICPEVMGDVNPYRGVTVADIVHLINYLFNNGQEPTCVRMY